MTDNGSIYERRGVPTVINAVGSHTRISGSLMRPEAAEAMAEASTEFVHIADLQARASELIAEVTGSEAGLVTNGAAAGLTLAAAACMAENDYSVMNQLPDTDGVPDEIVIPHAHRNQYDVAFRAAGAELVGVGRSELHPFEGGSEDVEQWELGEAISEDTAAVAYVDRPHNLLELGDVIEAAHGHGIPVIVDAAAELPPKSNLTRYIDEGADLVAFSGGKAIRGPQSSGILAGDRGRIQSAALQMLPTGVHENVWDPPQSLINKEDLPGMPRHGIGRGMKVGKEEVVGLIRALELFLEEDEEATVAEWNSRAAHVADRLSENDLLDVQLTDPDDPTVHSTVIVELDEAAANTTALDLVTTLHDEDPRVFVGEGHVDGGVITINTQHLTDAQADYVIDRIEATIQ